MYIPQIRFSETSKLQNDLISNGYGSSRALEVALNVKSTLERMTEADFKKMETATLQFRPYFEAEKDALIKCTNISKELNAFKSENFATAIECAVEIRKAQRLLANSKDKDVLVRAQEKLEHFLEIKDEIDKHAKELFAQERRSRNELDRAHFESFDERKKIYHAELNAHLIDHERFRNLVFVDLDKSHMGERRGDRVAVSLEGNGEVRYHALVKNHKYAYVPTAPRSTVVIEMQSKDEDWRADFR